MNNQGVCLLKTKCRICGHLLSYHNSSWTCASNHILFHNLATAQDIAIGAVLATKFEADGKPFPIYKVPNPPLVKKEPLSNVASM